MCPALTEPRIGLTAIFKNEAPYVLEWLAHHRLLGIGAFFIADNESSDGTSELLQGLASAGLIHHLRFPNPAAGKPQLPAYRRLLELHGAEVDWMAIIDADEFIWPDADGASLGHWLASLGAAPDVGAVVLNWAIYGSSGEVQPSAAALTRRLSARAEQAFPTNRHVKSVVRPEAVQAVINPHCVELRPGWRSVHADGSDCHQTRPGISQQVRWAPFRINHYVVKSWTEYMLRKRPRGTADGPDDGYSAAFFHEHDRNDVIERADPAYLRRLEDEVLRLREILSAHGVPRDILAASPSHDGPVPQGLLQGSLESVACDHDGLRLTGWALSRQREPLRQFAWQAGESPAQVVAASACRREDVARLYPGSGEEAGFVIEVPWPAAGDIRREGVVLFGIDATGVREAIPVGPLVDWVSVRRVAEQGCDIGGHIDSVEVVDAHLVVRGWGLDWKRHSLKSLELRASDAVSVVNAFHGTARPDVTSVYPQADRLCGFEGRFPLPLHGQEADLIGINALDRRGLIGRIPLPAGSDRG